MEELFKNSYKSGIFKKGDEEEWTYRNNGSLKNTLGLLGAGAYQWDGQFLLPVVPSSASSSSSSSSVTHYGWGEWTGYSLKWYTGTPEQEEPKFEFTWNEATRYVASR